MTRDEAEEIYMAAQIGANYPAGKLAEAVLILSNEPSIEDIPDDVCCCGDAMKNHESAISCGHTPLSMRAHALAERGGGGK